MTNISSTFKYFETTMRAVSYLGFWLVLTKEDVKFANMGTEVVHEANGILGERAGGLAKYFKEGPEQLVEALLAESKTRQEEIKAQSPELEPFAAIGATIGVIEGGLPWVGKTEKSPYVEGVAKIIATYSDRIPEPLRTPLANLAKYDGDKLTSENAEQVRELVEEIKSKSHE